MCVTKKQKSTLDSNKRCSCEELLGLQVQPFPSSWCPAPWASSPGHWGTGAALLPTKDRTKLQPALGHELELYQPCSDLPPSQGDICLVWHHNVHRMLPLAPGLPQVWYHDIPAAALPELPSVSSKRMKTENVSHSALPMHYVALSCPAVYTIRAEELAVYGIQMTKRPNSFQCSFGCNLFFQVAGAHCDHYHGKTLTEC